MLVLDSVRESATGSRLRQLQPAFVHAYVLSGCDTRPQSGLNNAKVSGPIQKCYSNILIF